MKYVKLFEQFVNEVIDLKSAYPYNKLVVNSGNDGLHGTVYDFTTDGGVEYEVSMIAYDKKQYYDFSFKQKGERYDSLTNENDSIKVLSTIGRIFIEILQTQKLLPIPIKIRGSNKEGENTDETSARDRIYKHMVRKEMSHVKPGNPTIQGYQLVDMYERGFLLEPINVDDDELESEGLNVFNDKQDKIM